MRLLILGESDSIGMALADPSLAWGNRVPAEVELLLGERPETTHVRFYPWTGNSEAYFDKVLAGGPFDAIVISATKVAFTIFSADNRIRRVFGDRVGDRFREGVRTADRATRWGKRGVRRRLNDAAHKVARSVIGQAPDTSAAVVAKSYFAAFARLAQLEDVRVVVVAAPPIPPKTAKRHPRLTREVEWFRSQIRAEAGRRYFDYVDTEASLPTDGLGRDAFFVDDIHKTPALHALVGASVARAVAGGNTVDELRLHRRTAQR